MTPHGIAIYPDRGKSTLDSLPRTTLTRTYHESVAGLVERSDGQLVQLQSKQRKHERTYREREREEGMPEARSLRGAPGRETASVRRRPTTVRRELADAIMLAVLDRRSTVARSNLARAIGVTPRELHLAELGCVQPAALPAIAGFFGIDLRQRSA
jgi:hypothetical protein